jgi:site-specific recombinase XerD
MGQATVHSSRTEPRGGELGQLMLSFDRSLRALDRSPLTRDQYLMSVGQMLGYFAEHGLPTDATHVTRDHLETFLSEFAKDHKPATVQTRYKCLRLFFSFLLEENEISQHPMGNMKPPLIPATPVSILEKPQLEALLRTAEGRDFDERRDAAILRLFVDTGMRRGEMAGLTIGDIDLEQELAHVSNGNRSRACPFGPKTARALDRYLRARAQRSDAGSQWLWLGKKGRLSDSGMLQMVRRRGQQAGLGRIHPDQLRHSFAHAWLADGGQEADLMQLAGWRSRQTLQRYAASAAGERAREAHRRLSLGDQL